MTKDGLLTSYSYDAYHAMTSSVEQVVSNDRTRDVTTLFTYDANGNLTEEESTRPNDPFDEDSGDGYDIIGTRTVVTSKNYGFDPKGRMISSSVSALPSLSVSMGSSM